jgi:hypothetical protein
LDRQSRLDGELVFLASQEVPAISRRDGHIRLDRTDYLLMRWALRLETAHAAGCTASRPPHWLAIGNRRRGGAMGSRVAPILR